jgi:hypothetical protein
MSEFVWLDYSEKERRKMLEVVDLFKEHDTRDELGIGSVRDAFADQLFPGTSTIMTRAKYFLLVAWTYQRLEKQRISSEQFSSRARRSETDLIEVIASSEDNEGNIGKYAKTTLKRLPSSVYWQGLHVWGVRNFEGAQAQYYRSLDHFYIRSDRHSGRSRERDVEHDDLISPNWHAGIVSAPGKFPNECSLSLTEDEAKYVRERIRLSPKCAGSLLAELVGRTERCDQVDFPWWLPHLADLPLRLQKQLDHARNFSELMHGAPLIYNLILAEQEHQEERVADYRTRFADWAREVKERLGVFDAWKRPEFWEHARGSNARIGETTSDFINAWWDCVLGGAPGALSDDPHVRSLITNRERRLKKSLARIGNPRARELWSGEAGTARLDFRWQISQNLISDIFDGLGVANASAR